jgi:hypothetical protein
MIVLLSEKSTARSVYFDLIKNINFNCKENAN